MSRATEYVTLSEAAKKFVAYSEDEGRRRRTVVKQRGILNRFIAFATKNNARQLAEVSLLLIDSYRSERKESLSLKSMHNEGQLLKQFLAWCTERHLIDNNPLANRRFRPPKAKRRPAPSLRQVNAILKTATSTRQPVLATLAFSGARSGEVAHLRVEDVDLEGVWLHFVSRPGFETKTGNSRKLPIHRRLRPVLEKAVEGRKSGWLFTALPSRKYPGGDNHISTKHLNEDFLKVLRKLNIPAGHANGFTVHSLRRFFKTFAVNNHTPRDVVDFWQDHAQLRTPGDLYYTLSDEESQEFMKQVPFDAAE